MNEPRLRHSVRALILDEDERVLLCRIVAAGGLVAWVTPGGGIEKSESHHVWHQELVPASTQLASMVSPTTSALCA